MATLERDTYIEYESQRIIAEINDGYSEAIETGDSTFSYQLPDTFEEVQYTSSRDVQTMVYYTVLHHFIDVRKFKAKIVPRGDIFYLHIIIQRPEDAKRIAEMSKYIALHTKR